MSNEYFRFKEFTIKQDKCAMKVGTDGVLLGAWTKVEHASNIADIGTGTGLIAIMLAQKSKASVVGIEIDQEASIQASENMNNTHWKDRLKTIHADISDYYLYHEAEYDLIVSNPPFFKENTKGYSEKRNIARHTEGLDFDKLTKVASYMLKDKGRFCLIIPYSSATEFIWEATKYSLNLTKRTDVITKEGAIPKRVLLEFRKNMQVNETKLSQLVLTENGNKSLDYQTLTYDYYL